MAEETRQTRALVDAALKGGRVLRLERTAKRAGYTIGRLVCGGVKICDTLEPASRGLTSSSTAKEVEAVKKRFEAGKTAVPTGVYRLRLDVVSPRFGAEAFYAEVCGGRLPRLDGVTGFRGVLIHCGNTAADTEGCILVGINDRVGWVSQSRATFRLLWQKLERLAKAGPLFICIRDGRGGVVI